MTPKIRFESTNQPKRGTTMKLFLAATTALALFAAGASASVNERRERPDPSPQVVTPAQTDQVRASTLYSNQGLQSLGLDANDMVEVTIFPSTGIVDAPSRDD
jgi:hypothetical protein